LAGKNIAPLEEQLNNIKWGTHKIGDLFTIHSSKKRFDANKVKLTKKGYPYIVRQSTNNGQKGCLNENITLLNESNTISFGQDTATVFYQEKPYFTGDKIKILQPKDSRFKKTNSPFFLVAIQRAFSGSSWGAQSYSKKVISKTKIALPQTLDGDVDFVFMDNIIRKLSESRFRELENYLLATGLNNYILTDSERSALRDFDDLQWREFILDDIFKKTETKKLSYKAKDLPKQPKGEFTLPCLTSSFMNQGLNYYAPRNGATILSNVISIPSNSDVYRAYYQPNEFTVLSDAYAIQWKDESIELQDNQYLFFVACINKITDLPIYSYKNKLGGWKVVKNKHILLPVNANKQPDLTIMGQVIHALQKIVIADVVEYTKQHFNTTPKVVELDNQHKKIQQAPIMVADPFERYKWNSFNQSICDFFGGNQTILVGCYKGKKYRDWIQTHNLYNIRLGKTKGSMEANRELFDSTTLLILYELGKPNKLNAYQITGHHEISKDELIKMGYPNKKPRKSYMAFDITPLDMDLTFLVEHHLIERLVELNAGNAKGTPVFIEP